MNSRVHPSRTTPGGFTLIEVLVSVSVLALIMVGVAQMMNTALSTTLGGYKHMDADTQARMVLDRMAFDISKITKRSDVDYYFQKNAGNDQMAFYSESGGYYPSGYTGATQESDVSLVGYMITNNQMVRLSKGLVWNGVSASVQAMVFNPNPTSVTSNTITTNWPLVSNGTDPNYQVIGDQIFRFEYSFLVQTPRNSAQFTTTKTDFYDSPWITPDTTPAGLQDVAAIVVSIAVLDTKSRATISSATLSNAATKLSDDGYASLSTSPASLPLSLWKTNLSTTGLGLPQSVASQVRFYQRYCYLNHLQ
jgi:prepilin-type N-terminal cleavage/methylation domain-containing protein